MIAPTTLGGPLADPGVSINPDTGIEPVAGIEPAGRIGERTGRVVDNPTAGHAPAGVDRREQPGPVAGEMASSTGPRGLVHGLVRTARPHQWIKNALVLAAPLAGEVLTRPTVIGRLAVAVIALCLAASGTYFLNDVVDADADRTHPTKRNRPVAAGTVSPSLALMVAIVLLAGGMAVAATLGIAFVSVVGLYIALTVSYSTWLKRIPIIDIAAVASGFLLRALAGAVAAQITVTGSFLLVASFAASFLVVGKRHGEHLQLGTEAASHRAALSAYTPAFTAQLLSISVTATLVSYATWAFGLDVGEGGVPWVGLSVVPFAIGMLRATQLVVRGDGADPEELLRDRGLAAAGALTAVLLFLGLYIW